MTFRELMETARAAADFRALMDGRNPFLTRDEKLMEIEELKRIAEG